MTPTASRNSLDRLPSEFPFRSNLPCPGIQQLAWLLGNSQTSVPPSPLVLNLSIPGGDSSLTTSTTATSAIIARSYITPDAMQIHAAKRRMLPITMISMAITARSGVSNACAYRQPEALQLYSQRR
ncbi:tyrosine-protein phosphatase non-receptor type 14 [Lates japonicus]|uniref:Tyrosine-protein phosphatase non-receptor type 14 n=1 Tax=Lates japonicus TaxID=270547 RepID=A0AAD3ND02_LATJO|nr:tyrosine-protein phosphatase non-receptor type 14 [Lates japonicus]